MSSELSQPSTEGTGYGSTVLDSANTPKRIFEVGQQSGSIIMRADLSNSNPIFLGFDDNVTVNNGFPLEAGDSISIDLDVRSQDIFFVGAGAGDSIRWLAIN